MPIEWEKESPSKIQWEDSKDTSLAEKAKIFSKASLESLAPTIGGIAGAGRGAAIGAEAGSFLGPYGSLAGGIAGGLAGGFIGGAGVEKAQEKALEFIPESVKQKFGYGKEERKAEKEKAPYTSFAGELAPSLLAFRPGSVDKTTRLLTGAVGAGVEAGREIIQEGKFDPVKITMAGGFQAVAPKTTKFGSKIVGEKSPVITGAIGEKLKETPKTKNQAQHDVEALIGTNINNKNASLRLINNNTKELEKIVPDKNLREEIPNAIESNTVESLPENQRNLANKYRTLVDDIGERAVEKGVLKGTLDNYVTHIVDWEKSKTTPTDELLDSLLGEVHVGTSGISSKSRFAKARKYETLQALEEAIKNKGLVVKTKDISEIYSIYAKSMERAIENKTLVENLQQVKNAEGYSLIKKITEEHPLPRGWEVLDKGQFRGYAVHPDLMPSLQFALDTKDSGLFLDASHTVSQAVKRLNVVGSFFHAKSLLESLWSATNPVYFVKELSLASLDKAFGTKYAGVTKALDQYKNGGMSDSVDSWLKNGLIVTPPEDISKTVLSSIGKFGDSLINKFGPETKILEKALSTTEKYTLGLFDKITWDFLHTGLKLSVAEKYLEKAMKDHPDVPEDTLRQEIASFVNNSFGGLNWFDVAHQSNTELGKRMAMAAYSPSGRKALQVLLFAPDWTVSTVRALTTGLSGGTGFKGIVKPQTQADFARRYQLKTALTYLTLLNGVNLMTANHPIWENKDPTRIEFPDGTSLQAAKHAMEPYHWIADPDKTLTNKLGFIPRSFLVGFGGLEYASPYAPKLMDTSISGRLKAVSQGALPFQVQAFQQAPTGEEFKRALAGTLGFPVYGKTKQQQKQEAKQKAQFRKELAKERKKRQ